MAVLQMTTECKIFQQFKALNPCRAVFSKARQAHTDIRLKSTPG